MSRSLDAEPGPEGAVATPWSHERIDTDNSSAKNRRRLTCVSLSKGAVRRCWWSRFAKGWGDR